MKIKTRRSLPRLALLLTVALAWPASGRASAWEELQAAAGGAATQPAAPATAPATGPATAPAPQAPANGGLKFVQKRRKSLYGRVVESAVQVVRADGGLGSGTVIDLKGHILTNAHVVGNETEVDIIIYALQDDGSTKKTALLKGKVLGKDDEMDIAVVEVPASAAPGLKPIVFGDSDKLSVSQKVHTLGCPYGIAETFAEGTVSGLGKPMKGYRFIQINAAINPGNSGGALLNAKGEQIGVNSMITTSSKGYEGIGWSIPINRIKGPIQQIIKNGKVTHGMVGIEFKDLEEPVRCALATCGYQGSFGVMLVKVAPGKPAEKAGLKKGDVLHKIGAAVIAEMADVSMVINEAAPGDVITFDVFRGGKTFPVKVTIEDRDPGAAATAARAPATAPSPAPAPPQEPKKGPEEKKTGSA